MATKKDLLIRKGRTGTLTVIVTGVSDWEGKIAKLFATDRIGNPIKLTLNGDITPGENKIAFNYENGDTNVLPYSSLEYEIVVYKEDLTYVKDTNYGSLVIDNAVTPNPA